MLTIRPEQFIVFSQVEAEKFEDWMVAHMRRFFPRQSAAAGEQNLREMVRYGVPRARQHGITARRDVAKYVDLMLLFGRDFDTDRRARWAGDILAKRRHSAAKMQALLAAAKKRLGDR